MCDPNTYADRRLSEQPVSFAPQVQPFEANAMVSETSHSFRAVAKVRNGWSTAVLARRGALSRYSISNTVCSLMTLSPIP